MKNLIATIFFAVLAISASAQGSLSRSEQRQAAFELTHNAHQRGYRGAVEVFPMAGDAGIGLGTTHGAQINPHIYVGGGLALLSYSDIYDFGFVYADVKYHILNKRVTPFVEVQPGFSDNGFCMANSVGASLSLNRTLALNFNMGYLINDRGVKNGWGDEMYLGSVIFKLGFEF